MTNQTASLEYRRASTQQASIVGLVIALHDTLIGNLQRAADAMDKNDIAGRCDQMIHGFKVLQQLEAMVDMERGGVAAVNIRRFYTHVRGQMLAAQFKLQPAMLREQARIVLEVRLAWQQVDSSTAETAGHAASASLTMSGAVQVKAPVETRMPFSCSI